MGPFRGKWLPPNPIRFFLFDSSRYHLYTLGVFSQAIYCRIGGSTITLAFHFWLYLVGIWMDQVYRRLL